VVPRTHSCRHAVSHPTRPPIVARGGPIVRLRGTLAERAEHSHRKRAAENNRRPATIGGCQLFGESSPSRWASPGHTVDTRWIQAGYNMCTIQTHYTGATWVQHGYTLDTSCRHAGCYTGIARSGRFLDLRTVGTHLAHLKYKLGTSC
jgi:hypothetical protein